MKQGKVRFTPAWRAPKGPILYVNPRARDELDYREIHLLLGVCAAHGYISLLVM